MRFLTKASLGLLVLLASIAFAPPVKADPIVIHTDGFSLSNLENSEGGISDALFGAAASISHDINGAGSFVALLDPLTFTTGFNGPGSGGTYAFNFSQLLAGNGQTQTLNLAGIGSAVDSLRIFSSTPLTFNFNTFSVDVRVLPANIDGIGPGVFRDMLKAKFTVTSECTTVPEPATLSLLGLGLAGVAAKFRRRRKQRT